MLCGSLSCSSAYTLTHIDISSWYLWTQFYTERLPGPTFASPLHPVHSLTPLFQSMTDSWKILNIPAFEDIKNDGSPATWHDMVWPMELWHLLKARSGLPTLPPGLGPRPDYLLIWIQTWSVLSTPPCYGAYSAVRTVRCTQPLAVVRCLLMPISSAQAAKLVYAQEE